jgi:hypothetical protein
MRIIGASNSNCNFGYNCNNIAGANEHTCCVGLAHRMCAAAAAAVAGPVPSRAEANTRRENEEFAS